MRTSLMVSFMVAALAMAACADKEDGGAKGKGSAEAAAAKESKGGKGLGAADNDKGVVDLAKKAIKCDWTQSGLKWDCPDLKAFKEHKPIQEGNVDATLVNLLEDKDEKVRWLAANVLTSGKSYAEDATLAKRVIAAAQAEANAAVASELGSAACRIKGDKVGQTDALKKLITDHKLPAMRRAVVSGFMFSNSTPDNFRFVSDIARKDKEIEVRRAAASSFWVGTPSGLHGDACKLWLELAADADKDLAGNSAYHCAFFPYDGGCKTQWDPLLGLVEKKAQEGTVQSSMMASALSYLHDQKESSDAQKKKCLAVAKAIVENDKNDAGARGNALEFVGKKDPGGKAFAKKFVSDKEFFVKSAAERASGSK